MLEEKNHDVVGSQKNPKIEGYIHVSQMSLKSLGNMPMAPETHPEQHDRISMVYFCHGKPTDWPRAHHGPTTFPWLPTGL